MGSLVNLNEAEMEAVRMGVLRVGKGFLGKGLS